MTLDGEAKCLKSLMNVPLVMCLEEFQAFLSFEIENSWTYSVAMLLLLRTVTASDWFTYFKWRL